MALKYNDDVVVEDDDVWSFVMASGIVGKDSNNPSSLNT